MASQTPEYFPPPPPGTRPNKPGPRYPDSTFQVPAIVALEDQVSPKQVRVDRVALNPPPISEETKDDSWCSQSFAASLITTPAANDYPGPVGAFVSGRPPSPNFTTSTTIPQFGPTSTSQSDDPNSKPRSTWPEGVPPGKMMGPIGASMFPMGKPEDHLSILQTQPGTGRTNTRAESADEESTQEMAAAAIEKILAAQKRHEFDMKALEQLSNETIALPKRTMAATFDLDEAPWERSQTPPPVSTATYVPSTTAKFADKESIFYAFNKLRSTVRTNIVTLWKSITSPQTLRKPKVDITHRQQTRFALGYSLAAAVGIAIGYHGHQELKPDSARASTTIVRTTLSPRRPTITPTSMVTRNTVTPTAEINHYHRITLRNDRMPATIASAIKGYLLKDYSREHGGFSYQAGIATQMSHELRKFAPNLFVAIHNNAQIGDSLTFATLPTGQVVLTSYQRKNRELLSSPIIFGQI